MDGLVGFSSAVMEASPPVVSISSCCGWGRIHELQLCDGDLMCACVCVMKSLLCRHSLFVQWNLVSVQCLQSVNAWSWRFLKNFDKLVFLKMYFIIYKKKSVQFYLTCSNFPFCSVTTNTSLLKPISVT